MDYQKFGKYSVGDFTRKGLDIFHKGMKINPEFFKASHVCCFMGPGMKSLDEQRKDDEDFQDAYEAFIENNPT